MRDPAFRADHLRPSTSPELGLNAPRHLFKLTCLASRRASFPNGGLRIYLRSEPQAGRCFQFFTLCGSNFGRLDLPGSFDQGDLPAALGILPLFCSCDLSLLRCVLAGGRDLDGLRLGEGLGGEGLFVRGRRLRHGLDERDLPELMRSHGIRLVVPRADARCRPTNFPPARRLQSLRSARSPRLQCRQSTNPAN